MLHPDASVHENMLQRSRQSIDTTDAAPQPGGRKRGRPAAIAPSA